ncbi:aKG-HExxH-type peptide beta-hydroxylase [Streptomyces sp. NPDC017964]|uniref:aKG-HExxH-type peptide beta-hydroxylase n=1 Tax=Streptomyces sp. NPDC017964 TaxID=3365022 RepID=UPI003791F030
MVVSGVPSLALPDDIWDSLVSDRPDTATPRLLRAARGSRNLLLLRALHERGGAGGAWGAAVAVLSSVRTHAPDVFTSLIEDPATGARLARAVREGGRADVSALAAVAGHRSRAGFRLEVPVQHGVLTLPGLGAVAVLPGVSTALVERGAWGTRVCAAGTVLRVPDGPQGREPGWEPVRHLTLDHRGHRWPVRIDSLDPLRLGGPTRPPHPLEPPEQQAWEARLDAAWRHLVERHPGQATAVSGTITAVVPLDALPGAAGPWLSASFGDAVGLAALAPLDDPVELAAALVHEARHSALYALLDLTELLTPAPGELRYAPWSDRPRPLSALLQGACAFHATASFWHRELLLGNPNAQAPFVRWRLTARTAVTSLAREPWPTEHGRRLLDSLERTLTSWETTRVEPGVLARELGAAARHRVRWRLRHSWADPRVVEELADAVRHSRDVGAPPAAGPCRFAPDTVEFPPGAGARLGDVAEEWLEADGAGDSDDAVARLAGKVVEAADRGARALVAVPELVRAVHARVAEPGVPAGLLDTARRLAPWAASAGG